MIEEAMNAIQLMQEVDYPVIRPFMKSSQIEDSVSEGLVVLENDIYRDSVRISERESRHKINQINNESVYESGMFLINSSHIDSHANNHYSLNFVIRNLSDAFTKAVILLSDGKYSWEHEIEVSQTNQLCNGCIVLTKLPEIRIDEKTCFNCYDSGSLVI